VSQVAVEVFFPDPRKFCSYRSQWHRHFGRLRIGTQVAEKQDGGCRRCELHRVASPSLLGLSAPASLAFQRILGEPLGKACGRLFARVYGGS